MAQRFRTILTGRNLMDALRKSLSTVGKWAAQPAKGRKPKKAASGQREMLMAISGKGEAGRRQGNKAAGTSAQIAG
jgi:DNA end-binding protein Ku